MIGEIYEIFKFLLGIINGEYSKSFFYILILLLVITFIVEIFIEKRNNNVDNYIKLISEKIFWNVLGIIFYISMYMFIMRFFSNIPFFTFHESKSGALGEMGILSYTSTILIVPIAFLILKTKKIQFKIAFLLLQVLLILITLKILTSIFILNITFNYPLWGVQIILSLLVSNILVHYSSTKIQHTSSSH